MTAITMQKETNIYGKNNRQVVTILRKGGDDTKKADGTLPNRIRERRSVVLVYIR